MRAFISSLVHLSPINGAGKPVVTSMKQLNPRWDFVLAVIWSEQTGSTIFGAQSLRVPVLTRRLVEQKRPLNYSQATIGLNLPGRIGVLKFLCGFCFAIMMIAIPFPPLRVRSSHILVSFLYRTELAGNHFRNTSAPSPGTTSCIINLLLHPPPWIEHSSRRTPVRMRQLNLRRDLMRASV